MIRFINKLFKETAGFTLAELATTVGIMGTLAAVAAPKFSSFAEGSSETRTVSNIGAILKGAENFYRLKAQPQSQSNPAGEGRGRFPNQVTFDLPLVEQPVFGTTSIGKTVFSVSDSVGIGEFAGLLSGDFIASPYGSKGGYSYFVDEGVPKDAAGTPAQAPTITVFDFQDEDLFSVSLTP